MIFSIDEVWKLIEEKEGQSLKTFSGLEFTYRVKGHEIFISRKDKSITYSSVKKALEEVEKLVGYRPQEARCVRSFLSIPDFY